ncbi:MAG: ABC transporter ATP-binding protein [Candidatus Kerfeldbacteria bacterium]
MSTIEVKNLKKYFKDTKAVDDITFNVEKGEIFGFLGPNGAGKTTTIRTMMDFIRPTSGEIKILGMDAQKDAVELKKKIGYLSGYIQLYPKWTGQTHIDFVKQLNGDIDISKKLIERFNFDPTIKTKKLSSGNRQKLGIIIAFMTKPELLIMDEPTNALDPLLQNEVYELIEEVTGEGATVFMSSHNLAEVDKVCSRVGIIKQGKMVAMEDIISLKAKRIYSVTARFAEKQDASSIQLEGLTIQKEIMGGYILNYKGDINNLIKYFNDKKLNDVQIEHASLEDIFLEFYSN